MPEDTLTILAGAEALRVSRRRFGQEEIAQVVDGELRLEPVLGESPLGRDDGGVVDENDAGGRGGA